MSALPVIALVGRPNVGKSTLFNRLTHSRDALVANVPGLTRDRQYGLADLDDRLATIIDTGGLVIGAQRASNNDSLVAPLFALMADQVTAALDEADVLLFVVDAREGVTPDDREIAERLRRFNRPTILVANKIDGIAIEQRLDELYALGLGEPAAIAAAHGRGISGLTERITELLPATGTIDATDQSAAIDPLGEDLGIVVSIIGRPNVGKSTLLNRLLGEDRVIVFDTPGTTRDSIYVPFERDGERYTLVDTAGIRRRGRVFEAIEKFSVVKTLDAVRRCHVVILVCDAREGLVDQDLKLLGFALEAGRGLILAMNKWDGMSRDARESVLSELDRRLDFAPWIHQTRISALHGSGVGDLLDVVRHAHGSARIRHSTHELTEMLEDIVAAHAPPSVQGRRIKLRYAHAGGEHPAVLVIHGNQTHAVPASYRRYLENAYRERLGLVGVPLRIELRSGENPFAGKRNPLTPRQRQRRERVVAHARKRERKR